MHRLGDRLDDEDYALIKENVGLELRPDDDSESEEEGDGASRQRKRLKRGGGGGEDEDEDIRVNRKKGVSGLENALGLDGDDGGEVAQLYQDRARGDDAYDSDDSMADFIENDEPAGEGGDGEGQRRKRKRRGGGDGTSGNRLREAEDIFGDDYFGDDDDEEGDGEERSERNVEHIYEPMVIKESYLSEQDNVIREADAPERLQVEFGNREPLETKGDARRAALWMLDQEKFACSSMLKERGDEVVDYEGRPMTLSERADKVRDQLLESITNVLCFMRGIENEEAKHTVEEMRAPLKEIIEKDWPEELQNAQTKPMLDIPFIARYRQEYWRPVMKEGDLWKVLDLDGKYSALRVRKKHLAAKFEARADQDGVALVREAQNEEALTDLIALFDIRYPAGQDPEEGKEKKGYRGPVKISKFRQCQDAKLGGLLRRFAITPKELAENLAGSKRHTPADLAEDPDSLAVDYVPHASLYGFREATAVLRAVKWMGARELACEPAIRRMVRERHFSRRAVVTCGLTRKGEDSTDTQHLEYQYMREHDWQDIEDEDFLRIIRAKQEGLLTVKVTLMDRDHDRCLRDLEDMYSSERQNPTTDAWNVIRRDILETALTKMLYPGFENELLNSRAQAARSQVLRDMQFELEGRLRVAPYYLDGRRRPTRIMSVCYGEPTECVVIDEMGEAMNFLSISLFVPNNPEHELRQTDSDKLREFIMMEKPQVLVIGTGGGLKVRTLKTQLRKLVEEMREKGGIVDVVDVLTADQSVAYKYALSSRGPVEFPRYSPLRLQAVSLARRLQDPLREMAGLCSGDSQDLLSLSLHPLQDMLDSSERLRYLHRAFINVVNDVGVDINLAADRQAIWSHTVQFIAGLGPRKAAELTKIIHQKGCVQYRDQLMFDDDVRRIMREVVWTNCCVFLQITKNTSMWVENIDVGEALDEDDVIHIKGGGPMERSRIHPEMYTFGMRMTSDALEEDNCMETVKRGMHSSMHEDLCIKLNDLDLDVYAAELEKHGFGKRVYSLKAIREELKDPFLDPRFPRKNMLDTAPWVLTAGEEFNLIIGESDVKVRTRGSEYVQSTILHQVVNVKAFRMLRVTEDDGPPKQKSSREAGQRAYWRAT